MPFYELTLLLRPMPKKEIIDCLKRSANLIWTNDGVLRQIDFLGFKQLPFKARGKDDGSKFKEANYFLCHLSLPAPALRAISPELRLDSDILRAAFNNANESVVPEDYECTLEEELKTPFFRESVQSLIKDKNVLTVPRRTHSIRQEKVKLIG